MFFLYSYWFLFIYNINIDFINKFFQLNTNNNLLIYFSGFLPNNLCVDNYNYYVYANSLVFVDN